MIGEAGSLLLAADRLLIEEPNEDGSSTVFPTHAMILTALAAEVAFKAAICREHAIDNAKDLKALVRSASKGTSPHNLAVLFSLLTPGQQVALRDRTLDTIPQTQTFMGIFNQDKLAEMPPVSMDFGSTTFDAQLENVSICFEEWRYSYELPFRLINKSFLRCLAEAAVYLFTPPPVQTPAAPDPASGPG